MNTPARLGAYAAGLGVIFLVALGTGAALGAGEPQRPQPRHAQPQHAKPQHAESSHPEPPHAESSHPEASHTESSHAEPQPVHDHSEGSADHGGEASGTVPAGLQISQDGYTLVPLTTTLTPGKAADFRFTVTGPDGAPVTGYQVKHEKKLHFIVVSRDLGGFWHLHPEEAGDGVWTVRLTLPAAGTYRAYADFAPEGGPDLTLGADLNVPGAFEPRPLPPAERTARVDGYAVTLAGDLVPGRVSKLDFTVSKDGGPVGDLEPYLGASGHLVAIRAGDLAYLHVHPEEDTAAAGVTFAASAPSGGDYRLFLDFKHEGTVHTAAFTVRAEAAGHSR